MQDFAASLPPRATVICGACPGVIACDNLAKIAIETDNAVSNQRKISLSLANMPDTDRVAFHVNENDFELPTLEGDDWKVIVLLVDADCGRGADGFIDALQTKYRNAAIVGGIMGGEGTPLCVIDGNEAQMYEGGILGLAIRGDVVFSSQVSRACKPCSALEQLAKEDFEIIEEFPGILLKTVQSSPAAAFISNGFMNAEGRMAFIGMTDNLEHGFTLQSGRLFRDMVYFTESALSDSKYIRVFALDPNASKEDLAMRLDAAKRACAADAKKMLGALLFTCNGRGFRFYKETSVESTIFAESVGKDVGLGGFFAGGEIGPEALAALPFDSSFRRGAQLQGFTSVFGCFFIKRFTTPAGQIIRDALQKRTFTF